MAVIKEYICLAHGEFESDKEQCPHGCKGTMIDRQFKTAFSISGKARGIDKTLNQLATDFNMTDISNNKGSVMESRYQPQQQQPDLAPRWASGGLGGLQQAGHQLDNRSALNVTSAGFAKPEASIPSSVKQASAKDLM